MSSLFTSYGKLKGILQEPLASGVASSSNIDVKFIDANTSESRTMTNGHIIPLVIRPTGSLDKQSEFCLGTVGTTTDGITTLTTLIRGLSPDGGYTISGDSSLASDWDSNIEISEATDFINMNRVKAIFDGNLESGGTSIIFGDGTASNFTINHKNNSVTRAYIRFNNSTGKGQFSNDGTNFVNFDNPGVGVLVAGNGIDAAQLALGTVQIDTTAQTNVFVVTSSGAGDENKVPILNASGKLATGFISAGTLAAYISDISSTEAEIDQVCDGVSASVTATNLNTLVGGTTSDADALHTHGGILIASGRINALSNLNNASENIDTTVSIPAGFTAGRIVMYIKATVWNTTGRTFWTGETITSGTTCVGNHFFGIDGSITAGDDPRFLTNSSYSELDGQGGSAKRDVTVSVQSISAGDGNDVTIRCAFVVTSTPGTNYSQVFVNYLIYAA